MGIGIGDNIICVGTYIIPVHELVAVTSCLSNSSGSTFPAYSEIYYAEKPLNTGHSGSLEL